MTDAERQEIVRRVRRFIEERFPHHGETSQETWRPEPPKEEGVAIPPEKR